MVTHRRPVPLLERERELDALERAWQSAHTGRGSLWFISAEAGGGKSRLAGETVRLAGSRALIGAAEPVTPPEPFLALCQALPGFAPAGSRGESVERAVTLLGQQPAPLLVLLEDLHFADEGTLAVVVRLAALAPRRPWLILATYRAGEGAESLHQAAVELMSHGQAERLDLAPLSREAVAVAVTEVRQTPPEPAEVDAILAESGGNPWFVETLAAGAGAVSRARDRMLLRLDRLEASIPGANTVLAALAPATRALPQVVVAELCGGDSRDLRRTLGRLRDAAVLSEQQDGWAFRHELLRRSLMEGMILADQQDAHKALAEVVERHHGRAAELAMHFAEARDSRAVTWAFQAAAEARAIDAHVEAFAQLERALRFRPDGELHRRIGRMASLEAYHLGRYAEAQRLAEQTLAIPGDEPEVRSLLHQRAANAARLHGDIAGAVSHMDDAERELAGRPVSYQMAYVATARLLQAVVGMRPERVEAAAARALRLATALGPGPRSERIVTEVQAHRLLSLIDQGNPDAFPMLESIVALARAGAGNPADVVALLLRGYTGAVVSLFNAEAADLHERCETAIHRHELGWAPHAAVYQSLEHAQCGRFDAARSLLATVPEPDRDTPEYGAWLAAGVLLETRAGAPERAEALLAAASPIEAFRGNALLQLARLERAMLDAPDLGELAQRTYAVMNRRRCARVAAIAALGLVRSGRGAVPAPAWLVADAPLRVFWRWAKAIEDQAAPALREAAQTLESMGCPYEAALARRDAGDLGDAYRSLNAIGATTLRQQVAEQLRTVGRPVPRRTRAAIARDGLTVTEREVCAMVAAGARNDTVAEQLGVSVRTVEAHLTRIYQKTSRRGRVALALWWREQAE